MSNIVVGGNLVSVSELHMYALIAIFFVSIVLAVWGFCRNKKAKRKAMIASMYQRNKDQKESFLPEELSRIVNAARGLRQEI